MKQSGGLSLAPTCFETPTDAEIFSSRSLLLANVSWLLRLLLLLVLPATANAQFNFTTNYTYTTNNGAIITNGAITITGYTGSGGAVVVPGFTNGYPVVSIGNSAFSGKSTITSVSFPDSIFNVGSNAFSSCAGLTNIALGSNLTSIGTVAFQYCSKLTSVVIPDNVTNIGSSTFNFCTGLTNIVLGTNVLFIGPSAFQSCSKLASVMIPASVTVIGSNAFYACNSLKAITVDPSNTVYTSVDGILFDRDQTSLIQFPTGKTVGSYTIPDSVTNIGDNAFYACASLTNVTMDGNASRIGNSAFSRCTGLTEVVVPDSVISIGASAFLSCTGLTNVTLGASVTSLGDSAFQNCPGLNSITLPNSVADIGSMTFAYCHGLTNLTMDTNLTSIDGGAFWYCTSLTDITFPDSVTNIGIGAFYFCSSLTNIVIPASVTSLGGNAFEGCTSLAVITVDTSNSVYSSLDGVLFDKSQATLIECPGGKAGSYTIPDTVTGLGEWAFAYCDSLTNITIGSGLTSLVAGTFTTSANLMAITVTPSNPAYSSVDGVLFDKSQSTVVEYPCGKGPGYTISNGVTSIGSYAFAYASNLVNITIPASVSSIGTYVFVSCAALSGVYFQGNAPALAGNGVYLFEFDNHPIVYYLPGTTGWGTTFGGLQTVLWNPQIETGNTSFGVGTNGFGFNIIGTTNITLVVEAATNLVGASWTALQSSTLTNGLIYFSDPQWTNYPARYYRLRSP